MTKEYKPKSDRQFEYCGKCKAIIRTLVDITGYNFCQTCGAKIKRLPPAKGRRLDAGKL